jgi:L-asparaginase
MTEKRINPVVPMGAMRLGSDSDFDGPRNILNAVRVCVTPEAKDKGGMVVFNNQGRRKALSQAIMARWVILNMI